ncbi:MAG: hypothetical protein IRZ07_06305 [Microbispora sp.]|nr:hypothetical protein [Microbispora sp.]
MDEERRRRFAKQYRGLTLEALDAGDAEAAKRNQELLFKQYRMMERALRRIVAILMDAAVSEYDEAQARDRAAFQRAVDAADADAARRLLDEHRALHRRFHNMYVDWVAELLSEIHEAYGTDRFYELMRETGAEFREDFRRWAEYSPEQLLDSSVFMQLTHPDGSLEVEEDEEKYTIRQHCGTGGRLMAEGRFDGEGALARIPVANPASLGEAGLPTYCAHCTVWNTVLTTEQEGHPLWVIEHPHHTSCAIHIYKDPSRIPEEYLARIRGRGRHPSKTPTPEDPPLEGPTG